MRSAATLTAAGIAAWQSIPLAASAGHPIAAAALLFAVTGLALAALYRLACHMDRRATVRLELDRIRRAPGAASAESWTIRRDGRDGRDGHTGRNG